MESGQLASSCRCSCTPVVDVEYSVESDRSPAVVVVEAIAAATDVDPDELPSLYDYTDPDAIDRVLASHEGSGDVLLGFSVATWNVFVGGNGRVRVCDASRSTDPKPVFESPTG